ncbi:DNA polymerase [Aliirhizobium cellulosilyticum]|uniref:DNA-directed DNA polymerase n=1 Tax=Aliirhizobium cellulosilyticum TaxID=393664 RepID=A0A7W6UXB6_9HYPH|nr:DNA polymerase [Rhizobium cellulosilyticum]MBB4347015.1 hypothetical protein [Rhizobium cellulosilyticum]MBB4410591.1 hypothetical protein [Rhizobium cellulosilyticum]MBB4445279.1 hypothetical protein [Rhizobium cellulosilyticum]
MTQAKIPPFTVYAGLDSEWVTMVDPDTGRPQNVILSYQIVLAHADRRSSLIVFPAGARRAHRLTMSSLLKRSITKALKEKVIPSYPDRIVIFGHFLRADLPSFKDFWPAKRSFDGIGRTFTAKTLETFPDDSPGSSRRASGSDIIIYGSGEKQHRVLLRFVDTMLLTPGRQGLAVAGKMVGLPKLEIPEGYSIDRMDVLLANDKEAFVAYAMRDAEVALEYGLQLNALADELGLRHLPSTLAGFGIPLLREDAKRDGIDLDSALGVQIEKKTVYSEKTSSFRTVRTKAPVFRRQIHDEFAALAYHGGRGEAFYFGPTPKGVFRDYDLPAAYTTAMCLLRPLNFDRYENTHNIDDFTVETIGAARVRFKFPAPTRFPCLPVRANENLYFPLQGVSICTAPEIIVAQNMGAEIEVLDGVIIPVSSDELIFANFTKLIQQRRASVEKGSLKELLFKEVGNSLYGKLAQGVHQKRVFEPRKGRMDSMPVSAVTSGWHAAYVTGYVRAVLGEILHSIPADRSVISVTTDGFLSDAGPDDIPTDGPLCQSFLGIRRSVFGTDRLLEEKHRIAQLISMKTRGQVTIEGIDGHASVLAKAGVKPDVSKEFHNAYMLDLFLNRYPGQKHSSVSLIGLQEMWRTESDLVALKRETRLNLEYDFKRKPVRPTEIEFVGGQHLAFETEPWQTADDAVDAAVRFRGWSRGHDRILKTLSDFQAWDFYYSGGQPQKGITLRSDGSLGHLTRQFLRALVNDRWGLSLDGMSYREVAAIFKDFGFDITVTDLKNAKRASHKLAPETIYVDDDTIPLLRAIAQVFPSVRLEEMVLPDHLEAARAALNL